MFGFEVPKIGNIAEDDINIFLAASISLAIIPVFGILLAVYIILLLL